MAGRSGEVLRMRISTEAGRSGEVLRMRISTKIKFGKSTEPGPGDSLHRAEDAA